MPAPRKGRTNFAKCITSDDPSILRHFKVLIGLRPMQLITSPKQTPDGASPDMGRALIIRKGRSSLQTVAGDFKDSVDAAISDFRGKLSGQDKLNRSQFLG